MSERAAFERLMDILDDVVDRAGSIHANPADFGTGIPLYRTEIHTIRAIGENSRINVSNLADHMGVTKGAVSQTIGKLAGKQLVRKRRSPDNAKETLLELTDLGWTGYHNHEHFHVEMFDAFHDYFGHRLKPSLEALMKAVSDLDGVLETYERRPRGTRSLH
jgi:DNA-binding MarR family transcriptional regulator